MTGMNPAAMTPFPGVVAPPEAQPFVRLLPNGMTIVLEPLPHVHSVSMGVWIRVGSAHEEAAECGMSHFLEHMLFKGTPTRNAHDIAEAIEKHGGHMNAYTSRDYTCIYAKVLAPDAPEAAEVLADVVLHSQLIDLEKERCVILEEIASSEDVPDERIHDLFNEYLFPGHSLGRPVAGTETTVRAMTQEGMGAFYRRNYCPTNMVFSAAGNFDPEAMYDLLAGLFAELPAGDRQASVPPPTAQSGVSLHHQAIGQAHIHVGFPTVSVTDPARYRFDLLYSILGGGSTSRLFERIREDEGLAYNIYAYHSSYSVSGVGGMYAAVAAENYTKCMDICFEEMRRLRDEPIPEAEIRLNMDQLKGGMLIGLENTFNRAARMAKSTLMHGRIIPVEEVVNALDAITADDLQAVAAGMFRPSQCALVVLGPESFAIEEQVAL